MASHNNLYVCLGQVREDVELFKKKFAGKRISHLTSIQNEVTMQRKYIIAYLKSQFKQASYELYLYYTGKGHLDSGNWKISTSEKPQGDQIKFQQIRDLWNQFQPFKSSHLYIFMDSCSSATWCERLQQDKNLMQTMSIFASCPKGKQRNPLNSTTAFSNCLLVDSDQKFQENFSYNQGATFCHQFKRGYLLKQQLKSLNQNIQSVSQISDAYIGQFKNTQRAGTGKIVYESGNVYQGGWQNDQPNGQGKLIFKNNDKYEGNWKDGKWHGQGTFYISNQSKFVGMWEDGKLVGKVELIFDEKNKKQLFFKNGEFKTLS